MAQLRSSTQFNFGLAAANAMFSGSSKRRAAKIIIIQTDGGGKVSLSTKLLREGVIVSTTVS